MKTIFPFAMYRRRRRKGDRLTFITIDTHLTMHCVYFLKETQHVDKSKRKEKFWCVKLQGCALLRKSKEFSNFTEKLNRLNEWLTELFKGCEFLTPPPNLNEQFIFNLKNQTREHTKMQWSTIKMDIYKNQSRVEKCFEHERERHIQNNAQIRMR